MLPNLVNLELPRISLTISSLQKVFTGCPSLKSLRCCIGHAEDPDGGWPARLRALMQGPGANLHEMDVCCEKISVLQMLFCLVDCKVAKISGIVWFRTDDFHEFMADDRNIEVYERYRIRQLSLCPRLFATSDSDYPDPYQIAKLLRKIVPSQCVIVIDTERFKDATIPTGEEIAFHKEKLWAHILRKTMETREQERRSKNSTKG